MSKKPIKDTHSAHKTCTTKFKVPKGGTYQVSNGAQTETVFLEDHLYYDVLEILKFPERFKKEDENE